MKPTKAFVLCAGLGTRFKPQTLFYPKPVLPFFNIPQALYSTSSLKEFGVSEFHYNSHHLSEVLDEKISPYFKNKGFYEKGLLDSAGGVSHTKSLFKDEKNFWVVNGDSFINYEDTSFLEEALELHTKNNALATLVASPEKKLGLNGLVIDADGRFKGLSREDSSLHFVGLYLLNTEILEHFELKPMKLFQDILLNPKVQDRVFVHKAPTTLTWYETGNEKDFIDCMKLEAESISNKKENSFVYRTYKNWGLSSSLDKMLEHFMDSKVWGLNSYKPKDPGSFLCLPESCHVDKSVELKDTAVMDNLKLTNQKSFTEKLLVDSSQV